MRIETNGVTLAVDVAGEGPTVLLLHGFPDSHRLWRHQVPALVAAGFRTVAPDLRGFGESSRPGEVAEYGLTRSVTDLVGLLDALQVQRAAVVGHDWGAAVAWLLATLHPDRVDRLAVLSVGHPAAFARRSLEQREKSWYMLLFQFEGVAERLLAREDWALLREWTRGAGDLEHWLADLSRPGALTAALGWYRANAHPARDLAPMPPLPPVAAPTLGVWSSGDDFLVEEQMVASAGHVAGGWRYARVEGASHWLQLDAPDEVTALLLGHLRGAGGG